MSNEFKGTFSFQSKTIKSEVMTENLKEAFKNVSEAFKAFDGELENLSTLDANGIKVTVQDGNVIIEGEVKSVKLNKKKLKI